MSKDLNKILFIFILGMAFYLRFHGITNGFPFIFHPDEPTIVRSALGVRFFPNPGHFDWPHLYIYFNYFFYMVFARIRDYLVLLNFQPTVQNIFPLIWDDELIYYLITRVFTALFSALTVIPVYLTARRLFGVKAGLLAGLAFALMPFNVRHSHYALPEGPMVFFLAWSMYFASKITVTDDPGNYAGAGAYAGFSASCKYNGGLIALMIPLAHTIRIVQSRDKEAFLSSRNIFNLVAAVLITVAGFVAGTPYALLDYRTFSRTDGPSGAFWQFTNVGSVSWSEKPVRFVTEMTQRVPDDTGYTFLAVFFLVYPILILKKVFRKNSPVDTYAWLILLYGNFLLFYVSGFARPRSHYYMIAYPFIAVMFGYFGGYIYELFERKLKAGILVIYALLFFMPFYMSVKQAYTFGNPDTRNILSRWLTTYAKPGSPVVYSSDDFTPVMLNYKGVTEKGLDKVTAFSDGYLILGDSLSPEDRVLQLEKYKAKLREVTVISNAYHNGPEISIYEITK